MNWEDVIEWFKFRLTYPRTGYVAPPSYWQNETTEPAARPENSRMRRALSVFGGFWFWLVLMSFLGVLWAPSHGRSIILLGVLLALRGLRFGLYPEAPVVSTENKPGVFAHAVGFLRSLLNSFWVWVFVSGLLPPPSPAVRPLVLGMVLTLSVFAFAFLRKLGRFQTACLFLCGAACALLVWRNSSVSIATAWLLPGLCAAFVGGLRLYRHLRANPVRSI